MENMKQKAVSGIVLMLLLTSMLSSAFNIQPVKAVGGTIYIRADGSVDPPTAPISTMDNVTYTFADNIHDSIVIQRDNIIVDGADYTIQGTGSGIGIQLSYRTGVTVKKVRITNFYYGIWLHYSNYNTLSGNVITNNKIHGIYLGVSELKGSSNNNVLSGNILTNNSIGIGVVGSSNNILSGNTASDNVYGIYLHNSTNNVLIGNTASNNGRTMTVDNMTGFEGGGIIIEYYSHSNKLFDNIASNNKHDGIDLVAGCGNSVLSGNDASNNVEFGIRLWDASDSTISNNTVSSTQSPRGIGIWLIDSNSCLLFDNTISKNGVEGGISLWHSNNNKIFHNNFINNAKQVYSYATLNNWDDGYPSGGNYWSDYTDVDQYSGPNQDQPESDGIWDHPYVIDENNKDRYPLVNPWTPTPTPLPKFRIGDWVQTTANLNVREGPGLSYTIIDTMPEGTIGQIVGGPVEADGFVWWGVDYAVGVRGWSVENWLEQTETPNRPPIAMIRHFPSGSRLWTQLYYLFCHSPDYEVGEEITFSGSWSIDIDGSISSYEWDFGDRSPTQAGIRTTHTYSEKGLYDVTLTVVDNHNEVASTSRRICVSIAKPEAVQRLKQEVEFIRDTTGKLLGDVLEGSEHAAIATDGFRSDIGADAVESLLSIIFKIVPAYEPGESIVSNDDLLLKLVAMRVLEYTGEEVDKALGKALVRDILNTKFSYYDQFMNDIREKEQVTEDSIVREAEETFNSIESLGLSRSEVDMYTKDLKARSLGNRFLTDFFKAQADLVYNLYDIKKQDSNSFSLWLGKRLFRVSTILLETALTASESPLWLILGKGAGLASFGNDVFEDMRSLTGDAMNYLMSHYVLRKSIFTVSEDPFENIMEGIRQNTEEGLRNIRSRVSPQIVEGTISSLSTDKEALKIDVKNTGETKQKYRAIMVFYKTYSSYELLPNIGRYYKLPTATSSADWIEIEPGKTTTIEITGIPEASQVCIYLLGKSDTGIYGLDMAIRAEQSPWYRDVASFFKGIMHSPAELRIYDQEDRVTGLVNGEVRTEIPNSIYDAESETVFIASPSYAFTFSQYRCAVVGRVEGTYGLDLAYEGLDAGSFTAVNIPISPNSVHEITINWTDLSLGEQGVTVMVDSDGDGAFEHTFTSDSELTQSEYVIATDDVPPQTWLSIGEPKFVVNDITYFTSSTSIELIAEDNAGGSGVASTAYRIYNATFDTGWITYMQPIYLTGLTDGTYHIDYYSIDFLNNTEPTNTATLILDNTPPVASFTWTPSIPKVGETVTFDASTSTSNGVTIVSYEWDFGDGGHATGKIVTHTYTTMGTYTVTLNVTDSLGFWDIEQKQIQIEALPPPPLSVSVSPLSASILVGQSVAFTSTVSGGYTPYAYQWYLNGNPVSGATSNIWTFTPTASGIYYVYLKVTDAKANTAQSETACVTVATVTVETVTGTGVAMFSTDLGTIENLVAVSEAALPEAGKPNLTFPHGFFSFTIADLTLGASVTVTITLPSNMPVGTQYWKYQTGKGWYQIPIGDDDGDNVITITLKDGGLGDADGANGVIVDPGGPGSPPPPPPVGGVWVPISKFQLLAPWISLVSLIMVATASTVYLRHKRKRSRRKC
jgi:parallel beta-helix repeat protein